MIDLINFVKSPLGILMIVILGLYFLVQRQENLVTNENIDDSHLDVAAPPPSYIDIITQFRSDLKPPSAGENQILQISETPTRQEQDVNLSIDPTTGMKLPPTVYEETRSLLPDQPSREGQQVWKSIVKRSSAYLSEDDAAKQAKQLIQPPIRASTITFAEKAAKFVNLDPQIKSALINDQGLTGYLQISGNSRQQAANRLGVTLADINQILFNQKASKFAKQDPQLAATIIQKEGLAGYLKSTGNTRQQAADPLGMTLSQVNQTLTEELNLNPSELELKYRADGELSEDVTLELRRKLDDAKRRLQVYQSRTETAEKIQQTDPKFTDIQTNWIANQ